MLYTTRFRIKESVQIAALLDINKLIDTQIMPALNNVVGVQAVSAHNSINGKLVFTLAIDDMATVDRILVAVGCRAVLGKLLSYTVRTGGEVLFDRPAWQEVYTGASN